MLDAVRLTIRVKASSPENRLIVEPDQTLTLRVTAPPMKGKANREIVKWFAKKLRRPSSQIRIVAGLSSNIKIIEILGMNHDDVAEILGLDTRTLGGVESA
jgi:hypothetical protein